MHNASITDMKSIEQVELDEVLVVLSGEVPA